VNYDDADAFRQDLEQRLEERCGDDGLCLAHARREIVFDRILARVAAAVPAGWSLSGDFALGLRFPERPRNWWNLDIEWPVGRYGAFHEVPALIADHDAGDLFEIELEESGAGISGRQAWARLSAHASLAQQHFETASVMLGLKYGALPTERLRTEELLGFAGIPPVEVETVLLEIQAAELLYAHIGECENGLKPGNVDGVRDLGLIAARSGLDAAILREVLDQIFARHEAEPLTALPHPFEGWAEPLRRMAETAGSPGDFLAGYDGVVALFDPVLSGEVEEGRWDATDQRWSDPSSNGHSPM
jgi:hypothetical protein